MRIPLLMLAAAAAAHASSAAHAQVLANPPLGHGQELAVGTLYAGAVSAAPAGAGAAAAFRSSGRVNVSARIAHFGDHDGGTSAELGTFAPLRVPGGAEVEWGVGLGYGSEARGMYVPVDLAASGEVRVAGVRTRPFAQVRLSLIHVDPFELETGHLELGTGAGVDVRMAGPWSVRAGVASFGNTPSLVLGLAHRR